MDTKKLILIIDDEKDFVDLMRFYLEGANFRVEAALTPEEGLQKANLKPDLILLDLTLPGMDGHEICKRIKENKSLVSIPVIMLTSRTKTIDKVEAFNLGAADYIGKHFSFEEILARIKAALRAVLPEQSLLAQQDRNNRILELRKIIDERNLKTLYQPILKLATRTPIGYEALTRGPAGSFLENAINLFTFASEENMFSELDLICLTLAAKRASFMPADCLLFINTDAVVLDKAYFRNFDFLKESDIKPSQICIEITERTCIRNFSKTAIDLGYFKSKGAKIAIDDVGEGYASLKSVAELTPEFIKIEMALVRGIDKDNVKLTLVQVIAELAKKIDCHVIAEGIETEEEFKTLASLGHLIFIR
jgi:EAL domain-containing protein (putative c-di-GMP-specific phosphodiesterase class I)/CheY-like chemotaxis protein